MLALNLAQLRLIPFNLTISCTQIHFEVGEYLETQVTHFVNIGKWLSSQESPARELGIIKTTILPKKILTGTYLFIIFFQG